MLDRCEPGSFNAAIGPGTCVGNGKVTFDEFISELMKKQTHHQWRNQPTNVALKAGRDVSVVNVGGEVHTFTPVAEFGGGFVADLNGLTGNPVPAPECLDFGSIEFVPAGGTASVGGLSEGTHRFMCCIHPWMRTTAEVH
jgi:plastocyanin